MASTPSLSSQDFNAQLSQAMQAWEQSVERRLQAREARLKARGQEPQDPEKAKQERKERQAMAKAMTKVLVPLAEIGAKEAIEKAIAQGGSLKGAIVDGRNPAMAAIDGGHKELALWICRHPDHQWRWEGPSGRAGRTELSSAINVDDPQLCEELCQMRPSLLEESNHGQKGYVPWGQRSLMSHAMSNFPKAAAWLAQKRPDLAKAWEKSAGAGSGALMAALSQGDTDSAAKLWPWVKNAVEARGKISSSQGAGKNHMVYGLLKAVLEADNPKALGWLLAQSPAIAAKLLNGAMLDAALDGGISMWTISRQPDHPWAKGLLDEIKAAESSPGNLGLWAAREGALDCFEFLMSIPAFKDQFSKVQHEGKAWIFAMAEARDPAMVEAMERGGFDFSLEAAPGWGAAALMLSSYKGPTQKWLEMVGREKSSWLAPSKASGLRAFELVRSLSHHDGNLGKWEAVCEKAAMKSSAGRLSQTKQATQARKAVAARARL